MSPALLARIEEELSGLEHGIVKIELHVRDGRLSRAVVGREASILLETDSESAGASGKKRASAGSVQLMRGNDR